MNDYVFRNQKRHVPGLSEHERSDTQQVRHIRHLCSFAKADVNLTCVVYGLGEAGVSWTGFFMTYCIQIVANLGVGKGRFAKDSGGTERETLPETRHVEPPFDST